MHPAVGVLSGRRAVAAVAAADRDAFLQLSALSRRYRYRIGGGSRPVAGANCRYRFAQAATARATSPLPASTRYR